MEEAAGRDDSELVAAWLNVVMARYSNDDDRAATVGAKRSAVGLWRTRIKNGEPVGIAVRYRLAMQDFLRRAGPSGKDEAYRDGMLAAIAAVQEVLDALRDRLA